VKNRHVSGIRNLALTAQSVVAPAHDKDMAAAFLAMLCPATKKVAFQFFGDGAASHQDLSSKNYNRWTYMPEKRADSPPIG
jgi:hypothetical protein